MKKLFLVVVFLCIILLNSKYYEAEYNTLDNEISNSLIGLTIDGMFTPNFPTQESDLAIDSIVCDKGAKGVWDYKNWLLKVRNITENRTKCQVNFVTKYTESILNGTDPVLKDGLIPVMISDEGIVTKASEGWEWYDYETQKWANAVILNDETKEYYDGDIIPEDDIESYFVWIPRYKYKIWNIGDYETISSSIDTSYIHQIEIEFENKNVLASTGSTVGSWLTHPAFTSFDVNGIWAGKFETRYKGAKTTSEAENNINDSTKVQIKPNVYSWRNINVANAYLTSYSYKREYNSHMMKNTEWGSVAYLQHSKYGSSTSVRINNNEAYLTGYGSVNEPTCGYTADNRECNKYGTTLDVTKPWNTDSGFAASTTGNTSGVYDMSGGSREYMMSVMISNADIPCSGRDADYNSGFKGPYCNKGETGSLEETGVDFPDDKRYYDLYNYATIDENYNHRILGDATGEMGPFQLKIYANNQDRWIGSWYADEAWFVWTLGPWFTRGNVYLVGNGAGIFSFFNVHGSEHTSSSFRVILSF